ncbi:ABC transporter substrate-binding protein [Paenibacillus qinlingensis]|uniref:ABC transporter substrate-binding protein n=1 Tax=Paenibacillus qinlingensis TaxID=1837343 RepID=UPI0015663AE6|nr:sugar ABC transporter substrate-binding protein [Paenibacillus qinlingensis]NQX62222.1 sugar ABC transporter substrate-binding protein [Paenibacillus qinlingensis]
MKRMKFMNYLLIGLTVLMVLSACSSQTASTTPAPSGDVKAAATQKSEEITGEISFWSWSPEDNVWQPLIKAFNEKYPKIKVNYVRTPSADYDKKIQVAIQGGEVPDVMAFSNGPMIKNYTPILEPLAPLAEKSLGKDWQKLFKTTPMESSKKNDYKTIPTGVAVTPFLSYDVDLFKKVGAEPPKTYDELKQVVKKFEDAKLPGIVPRLGFAGGKSTTVTDVFYTLVNQIAPGKLYEADAGKAKFTDPVFIQATNAFKQFYTDKLFQDGNLTTKFDPDLRDMYEQKRQLPMILVGAWIMTDVANKDGLKIGDRTFGLVPMPTIAGGKTSVLINGDVPLGISKDSKHKEAAWRFVEFMATGEYQTILSKALQFLPVKEGLSMDKANLKTDIEKQSVDVILNALTNNVGGIRFLDNASIEQALFANLQKVATGSATPEQAMAEVQKASDAVKR